MNKAVINTFKREQEYILRYTPVMYSAFALALNKCEVPQEDIDYILDVTQDILVNNSHELILQKCRDEVGIEYFSEAEKSKPGSR